MNAVDDLVPLHGVRPWLQKNARNANTAQFEAFAVYLWQFGMDQRAQDNQSATICSKLSAIWWFHRDQLEYEPYVNASHAILLRGIRRFTNSAIK